MSLEHHAPGFVEDRLWPEVLPVLDIKSAIQILHAAFPLDDVIAVVIAHGLFVSCQNSDGWADSDVTFSETELAAPPPIEPSTKRATVEVARINFKHPLSCRVAQTACLLMRLTP